MASGKQVRRATSGSFQKGQGGRPPGSKNKTTLFKEAMREGFERVLEKEGKEVFIACVQKAKGNRLPVKNDKGEAVPGEYQKDENGNFLYEGGDTTAMKIILDRVVPVADVQKDMSNGKFNVNINISGFEPQVEIIEAEDAEWEETDE